MPGRDLLDGHSAVGMDFSAGLGASGSMRGLGGRMPRRPSPRNSAHAGSCASARLRPLGAVLRTTLLAVFHTLRIERAAHDVIAHAGQVLDAATPDPNHRVFLEVG